MSPLLGIKDVAAYFSIPARSVADAVRARRIRHYRIGKHVRIRPEWVEEYLAECEQPVITPAIPMHRGRGRSRL